MGKGVNNMYSKKELERMRIEGEKIAQEMLKEKVAREYKINEIQITCVHCKHNEFEKGKAMLNTRGMTFLDMEWLNDSATTLICKRCSYIHWFGREVIEIKMD